MTIMERFLSNHDVTLNRKKKKREGRNNETIMKNHFNTRINTSLAGVYIHVRTYIHMYISSRRFA